MVKIVLKIPEDIELHEDLRINQSLPNNSEDDPNRITKIVDHDPITFENCHRRRKITGV